MNSVVMDFLTQAVTRDSSFHNEWTKYAPTYGLELSERERLHGTGRSIESLEYYRPGGYHPVELGDRLGPDDRYEVVHKLGHGGFGTVWLCWDRHGQIWRAVKILMGRDSSLDAPDLVFLKRLGTTSESTDGVKTNLGSEELEKNNITVPLSSFWIRQGPNGDHLCLVLPFLGLPIDNLLSSIYGHYPEVIKDVSHHITKALAFMHSTGDGICHGDFRPDNILFCLADGVEKWPKERLLQLLGSPVCRPVRQLNDKYKGPQIVPNMPRYLVSKPRIDYGDGAGVFSTRVVVGDFGLSYPASQPPKGVGTGIPTPFAAPEALFEYQELLGPASDVWALMCTIIKVRLGFPAFGEERFEDIVQSMEIIMGPMPQPYRARWREWEKKDIRPEEEDLSCPITYDLAVEERAGKARYDEKGTRNYLHWLMRLEQYLRITYKQAAQINAQDYRVNSGVLPTFDADRSFDGLSIPRFKLDAQEADQLFDMAMSVFRWDPKERATAADLLKHPWFTTHIATVSAPELAPTHSTENKTAARGTSVGSYPEKPVRRKESCDQASTPISSGYKGEVNEDTAEDEENILEQSPRKVSKCENNSPGSSLQTRKCFKPRSEQGNIQTYGPHSPNGNLSLEGAHDRNGNNDGVSAREVTPATDDIKKGQSGSNHEKGHQTGNMDNSLGSGNNISRKRKSSLDCPTKDTCTERQRKRSKHQDPIGTTNTELEQDQSATNNKSADRGNLNQSPQHRGEEEKDQSNHSRTIMSSIKTGAKSFITTLAMGVTILGPLAGQGRR